MKALVTILALFLTSSIFAQISFSGASNNMTFNTCNDFIIDSGGQGGPGYSNGENTTITICPDTPGEIISVVFNLFALSTSNDGTMANPNLDYMTVFDGDNTGAATLGTYSGTQLQGVVIEATPLNLTGCLTFTFTSNTIGTGQFTASVSCETPCADPTAAAQIVGGISTDSIIVCVNEVINFADNGSFAEPGFNLIDYSWDFMDGTTANGLNVSHSYDVPGEYRVQLFVTDDNGCSNPNLVDLQVLVGTIPSFDGFPADTTLCLGEQLQFNAAPDFYEVTWDGFTGTETVDDGCLYDTLLGVAQEIELFQTGFNAGAQINSIADLESICVDLEHSFMGDLVLLIECPTGQTVTLHQQGGGGTFLGVPLDNGTPVDCNDPSTQGSPFNYCFTPTATDTWVDWVNAQGGFGLTLPAGDYASVGPMTDLIGCPLNGVWTMSVIDNWAADDGTVFGFGINFEPSLYPNVTTFTPDIGANSDSSFWQMPAQYASNLSADGNSIDVEPLTAGTFSYTYTVIDNFGCTNDSTVNVTLELNPQADAGLDTVICGGAAVPVELLGSVNGTGGGNPCDYTLNLEDSFGDSWNGNNLLVTIGGVQTSYTVATGSNASFTISIAHGTDFDIQFDGAGSFIGECSFEIVDPNGTIVYQDGQAGNPVTTVQTLTADCYGGMEFNWTPAGQLSDPTIPNPIATVNGAQVFTLSVNPTGHPLCVTTDDVLVSFSGTPNAGQDSSLFICDNGAPEDLFPLLGNNVSTFQAQWFDPNMNPVAMPYDPVTMPAGIYTYLVDSNGCTNSAEVIVTHVTPTISNVVIDSDCNACNGEITLTGMNGLGTYQYSIDNGGAFVGTDVFAGLCPGDYDAVIQDSIGCQAAVLVTVVEINVPVIDNVVAIDVDCNSAANGSVTITGQNIVNFGVDGPGGPQINQTGIFTGLAPGNYAVVVDNGFGCIDNSNFVIAEPAPLQINTISPAQVICEGTSATLQVDGQGGNGVYTYTWTENGATIGTGENITVTPSVSPTQYCVTMSEACGSPTDDACTEITFPVDIDPVLVPDVIEGCYPVDVIFSNVTNSTEVATTHVDFGDGQESVVNGLLPISHSYTEAGIYSVTVTVTSIYGCEYVETYTSLITAYNYPDANINYTPSPVSMFDPEVNLLDNSSPDVISWDWEMIGADPNTSSLQNPNIMYPEGVPAVYPVTLIVENVNGCTDSVTIGVQVISDVLFYAPNTFTPDGDEFNQQWRVHIDGIDVYDFEVIVYNRWGETVWESHDAEGAWDGTYGGKIVPSGTYTWSLKTKDLENDGKYEFQGFVTILR